MNSIARERIRKEEEQRAAQAEEAKQRMIAQIRAEGEKKEAELRSQLHAAKKEKKALETRLAQLQQEAAQMETTLQKMRGDLSSAEAESTRVKQLLIADKEAAKQSELEESRLEKKRAELEKQLADLEEEEASLDREEKELDKRCASVRSALDEVQRRRVSAVNGSFKMPDTLDGIETLEGSHANVAELERRAGKLMKKCHSALEELRRVRREKVGEEHRALLDLIEQKEDKLMALHRSIFIKDDI